MPDMSLGADLVNTLKVFCFTYVSVSVLFMFGRLVNRAIREAS